MDYAGTDATEGFYGGDENDHNHSKTAKNDLQKYYIGNVLHDSSGIGKYLNFDVFIFILGLLVWSSIGVYYFKNR